MQTPVEHIGAAVSMFYEGLSLNAIRRQLQQQYGVYPSDSTVYGWVSKYTKEAIAKTKDVQPNVGSVWLVDETVLKVNGKNTWFYDIIDLKTRYLLASHISPNRYLGDARIVLAKAAKRAGKKPNVVVSDSLPSYPQAIAEIFKGDTKHIRYKGITREPNNNILERFHGTLKARTKVMRGLKSLETARLFTDGWLVFYNFIRPHEALDNETPAKRAGVDSPIYDWVNVVKATEPKVEPVKWADNVLTLKTKEPDFSPKIPKNVQRMMRGY
jgi:putative transposase